MKIPIKKYVDDPSLTWEERYKRLEAHHKEETEYLIEQLRWHLDFERRMQANIGFDPSINKG